MLAPTPTPIKPSFKVDSPIQPTVLDKKFIRIHGRRRLLSEVEAIASFCFAQIIAQSLRTSFEYGHRLSKVDFETEVGLIIVL